MVRPWRIRGSDLRGSGADYLVEGGGLPQYIARRDGGTVRHNGDISLRLV